MSVSMTTFGDRARAVAVRTGMARGDVADRLAVSARARLAHHRDQPEHGAQAAEYAMVGGVGAAACTALWAAINNSDGFQRILELVMRIISAALRAWAS